MIVYGAIISPFVAKVMAFAAQKGLTADLRPAMPGGDDPAFRALSPFGKVPAFQDGDFGLADSSAIVTYIDTKYPSSPLIPADAEARGQVIWFDEFADTIMGASMGKIFFNRVVAPRFMKKEGDLAAALAAEKDELPRIFTYLENHLAGRDFLVGTGVTLADISVAVMFMNFAYADVVIDPASYPRLTDYLAKINSLPSLATVFAQGKQMLGM
jgi:glutathione S-transferase